MKKIYAIMMVMMMVVTMGATAQTTDKQQRLSREQLAEVQARHIAQDLKLDDKTTQRLIETYTQCQKEIWSLGPRPRRNMRNKNEEENEQNIQQRFDRSEKILNIRKKYYKEYSTFLTQTQIQRMYVIEHKMMQRFAQKGRGRKGAPGTGRPRRSMDANR